jgi:disease resistance protein RPM1
LWIAEGFIEEKRGKTPEQVAYEYLDELVQMSLAHVSRWDFEERIRSCRVSNLARRFILSKSEKDNFFTVLRGTRTSLDGEKT